MPLIKISLSVLTAALLISCGREQQSEVAAGALPQREAIKMFTDVLNSNSKVSLTSTDVNNPHIRNAFIKLGLTKTYVNVRNLASAMRWKSFELDNTVLNVSFDKQKSIIPVGGRFNFIFAREARFTLLRNSVRMQGVTFLGNVDKSLPQIYADSPKFNMTSTLEAVAEIQQWIAQSNKKFKLGGELLKSANTLLNQNLNSKNAQVFANAIEQVAVENQALSVANASFSKSISCDLNDDNQAKVTLDRQVRIEDIQFHENGVIKLKISGVNVKAEPFIGVGSFGIRRKIEFPIKNLSISNGTIVIHDIPLKGDMPLDLSNKKSSMLCVSI